MLYGTSTDRKSGIIIPHEPKIEKVLTEDARSNQKMDKKPKLKSMFGILVGIE